MNRKGWDVLLVLFNMTTKDQIVQVIKEARKPIKAREIARRFELHFNEKISKKEVNKIIHHQLSSKIISSGFPRYTYSLVKEVKNVVAAESVYNKYPKQEEINFDHSATQPATDRVINISEKVYILIDEYIIDFHQFRRTKDIAIRDYCLQKLEKIIEMIISNNLNVDDISKYLEKEVLIHKQIIGHKRVIKVIKEKGLDNNLGDNNIESSTLNSDLKVLIQKYESTYSDFIKLNRKPSNIKSTFSDLINELEKQSSEILDLIVKNILTNNTSLSDLENNCSRDLYIKIENNNDICSWVNKKDEDHSIEDDSYEDRLKEFKILCKQVWEDGVVDEEEQIEIDERIKSLELETKDANEIFEQIKGEYKELHLLDNFLGDVKEDTKKEITLFDDTINIDSKVFYIKITKQPMSPLFWHKFKEGIEIIYINKLHNQYNDFELPQLKKIITAICVTKLSFSSNQGDIFESRFKNYLELL